MAPPLGELARERLRGRVRLMGAAPHPALRATFPRWVKASAVEAKFPVKAIKLADVAEGVKNKTHKFRRTCALWQGE